MDIQGWVFTDSQHRFLSRTQKGFTKDAAKAHIFWGTQQGANEFFQDHPLGIRIRGIQKIQGWVLTDSQHRFVSVTQKGFTKDAAKAYIFWGTQQGANQFFQDHPLGIRIRGIQKI